MRIFPKLLHITENGAWALDWFIQKEIAIKTLEKEREALATKAFHAQRNGDIRLYSSLTAEAEALGEKIAALKETDQA